MSKVLIVASESTPYSKTGGLADVIGALPFALQEVGDEIAVVVPLYRETASKILNADWVLHRVPIVLASATYEVQIRRVADRGVLFYFVDCPILFDRPGLYGEAGVDYPDNPVRFAVFCRAVLAVMRSLFRPQVLHLHDWQSCLTAAFLRTTFAGDPTFYGIKILLTIHNLGYQGLYPPAILQQLQLPGSLFTPGLLEFFGKVNLLKAGMVFADAINTVSKGYAREIQTPEYGFGLDGLLRNRSAVVSGILNGVDYSEWSPETDGAIAAPYSVNDLKGKHACKLDLLRTVGLPDSSIDQPLIGIVSRFAGQKGFDLVEEILPELVAQGVVFVILGSGEPLYENAFKSLANLYPKQLALRIDFNATLAHKIEAGSDIFLMPSRYEPCGLNQIYSLRYGTVPVVRATGGLDDTIDADTGFKFQEYSGSAFLAAVEAALAEYKQKPRWVAKMKNGMRKDFSWQSAAIQYSSLFRRLVG